jgi:hypothetical protein
MHIGFWAYTILIISLFTVSNSKVKRENNITTFNNNKSLITGEYFPVNNKRVLIYESDFGETELKVSQEAKLSVFTFKGDDFIYRQKLLINEDGVFVKETYQKMKLLLIISNEGTFTYSEPLPRIKYPFNEGKEWNWIGKEYDDEDIHSLNVNARVEKIEKINVAAGTFDTIKLITIIKSSKGTKSAVTEWYAKDIGLVKMIAVVEGGGAIGTARDLLGLGEIVFELKEIRNN